MLLCAATISWACKPPDDLTGVAVQSVTHRSLVVQFDALQKGSVAVRITPIPSTVGAMKEVRCVASPCVVDELIPASVYDVQAIPMLVTQTQGIIYGNPSPSQSITTLPIVTLKDALQEGVDYCLDRKLAHTACFKAINDALGKVTQ